MVGLNHSIKVVSKRTGLSPHVIRIWEKRYQAVMPNRSETNRRLYSDEEIERLNLLRIATQSGHSIRNVAPLSTEDLKTLVKEVDAKPQQPHVVRLPGAPEQKPEEEFVMAALNSIRSLDSQSLAQVLNSAAIEYGQYGMMYRVMVPLIDQIGELWRMGELKVANEHIATATIRTYLGNMSEGYSLSKNAPNIVVATPAGQLHELGAALVGAAACNQGWRITYLGPSLPAEEIVGAAVFNKSRAVALSIVYPEDDPNLPAELTRLRTLLPRDIPILVGGRVANAYARTLDSIGAHVVSDLQEFCEAIDQLRQQSPK